MIAFSQHTQLTVHAWKNFTRSTITFPANRLETGALAFLSVFLGFRLCESVTPKGKKNASKRWLYRCVRYFEFRIIGLVIHFEVGV